MSYKVEILKGALKQLKKLSPELQERIQVKIDYLVKKNCRLGEAKRNPTKL